MGAMTPSDEDGADSDGARALPPDNRRVDLFWQEARTRIGLSDLDVYLGQNPLAAVPPPAWQFGESARLATDLADLVVSGAKTALASPKWEYDAAGEPLPHVGALGIVCDGAGVPVALVRTDEVDVVPFDQVLGAHAVAEGEGDLSLESWRRAHVRFLPGLAGRARDEPWPAQTPWPRDEMVLERVTCVFPQPSVRGMKWLQCS